MIYVNKIRNARLPAPLTRRRNQQRQRHRYKYVIICRVYHRFTI